jgi:hypothetical protein
MEARGAILKYGKTDGAPEFMWLEVRESATSGSDSLDYEVHASKDSTSVPPFAIETYRRGVLEDYEPRADVIRERALIPEELRVRIVQSQRATSLIDRAQSQSQTQSHSQPSWAPA